MVSHINSKINKEMFDIMERERFRKKRIEARDIVKRKSATIGNLQDEKWLFEWCVKRTASLHILGLWVRERRVVARPVIVG